MFAKEQESTGFGGIIKPYKLLEDCTIQQFLMQLRQNKDVVVTSIERANGCGCGCGCGGTVHHSMEEITGAGCALTGGSYFIEAVYREQNIEISFSGSGTITLFTEDPLLELTKIIR